MPCRVLPYQAMYCTTAQRARGLGGPEPGTDELAQAQDDGVVLFFSSPGVSFPARVEILGTAGNVLAAYDEFTEFADLG